MSWGLVAVAGATVVGSAIGSKSNKDAQKAQAASSDEAIRVTKEARDQARGDINTIFPQAIERGQQGFQGALDVFSSSLPQQANQFQQGNVAAQQAILSGLPQIQNALFGNQVDLSQLQPYQAQPVNFDFIPQNINPVGFQQEQDAANAAAANLGPSGNTGFFGPNNQYNTPVDGGFNKFLGGGYGKFSNRGIF